MKLFQTNNIDIVNYCSAQFEFDLPSTVVEKRTKKFVAKYRSCENVICRPKFALLVPLLLLWTPAQRKRASMLYFATVFFLYFFMAALFSGPGERRFAKVLHVVDLECH